MSDNRWSGLDAARFVAAVRHTGPGGDVALLRMQKLGVAMAEELADIANGEAPDAVSINALLEDWNRALDAWEAA